MAQTNFAALLDNEKMVWTRDVWKQARNQMFTTRFMGTSHNSMIHRVTELTKTERGTKAILHLVPDTREDGIPGDNTLDGNEAELRAYDETVQIDQLRQAHKTTGRFNDQKTVIHFREQARDQLAYWLADRMDQLAFLTLAGIGYDQTNRGGARLEQGGFTLNDLEFAADVEAPTSDRHVQISGDGLMESDTASLQASDTLGYRHIVKLQALAKERYMRGVRSGAGGEQFHFFITPYVMSNLKLDSDFIQNARHAGVRGSSNSVWAGGDTFIVDGLTINEFRHVWTNEDAADDARWGLDGNVAGCRGLMCGAQALGFVDLGSGYWDERDHHDYGNTKGISYGKMFGFKKPQFKEAKRSTDPDAKQDYGVIAVDMAV